MIPVRWRAGSNPWNRTTGCFPGEPDPRRHLLNFWILRGPSLESSILRKMQWCDPFCFDTSSQSMASSPSTGMNLGAPTHRARWPLDLACAGKQVWDQWVVPPCMRFHRFINHLSFLLTLNLDRGGHHFGTSWTFQNDQRSGPRNILSMLWIWNTYMFDLWILWNHGPPGV